MITQEKGYSAKLESTLFTFFSVYYYELDYFGIFRVRNKEKNNITCKYDPYKGKDYYVGTFGMCLCV